MQCSELGRRGRVALVAYTPILEAEKYLLKCRHRQPKGLDSKRFSLDIQKSDQVCVAGAIVERKLDGNLGTRLAQDDGSRHYILDEGQGSVQFKH